MPKNVVFDFWYDGVDAITRAGADRRVYPLTQRSSLFMFALNLKVWRAATGYIKCRHVFLHVVASQRNYKLTSVHLVHLVVRAALGSVTHVCEHMSKHDVIAAHPCNTGWICASHCLQQAEFTGMQNVKSCFAWLFVCQCSQVIKKGNCERNWILTSMKCELANPGTGAPVTSDSH